MIMIKHSEDRIEIEGHAGYADHGKDIVCAAISALTQIFVASVDKFTEDKIKYQITEGNAVIEYGNLSANAQLLLDSFLFGIELIADSYPNNVRIDQVLKS